MHDLLMALHGIPGGFFKQKEDAVTFVTLARSNFQIFIGNGEIELVNSLLNLGSIRAKLGLYVSSEKKIFF